MGMYGTITGNTNMSSNLGLDIQLEDSRATNINGYIRFKVKNTTGHFTQKCYAKIDLYSKQDLLAATKYAEINNFRANEERKFELKFKANEISRYNIEIVEDLPDKTNILNLFGWEIDLTNVFGMDLSNLFGINIAELFNGQNIKEKGVSIFNGFLKFF